MPFGLKNAGATYQRLMDKAFESQVGRNIEVYVDDLVVKSYTEAEMMRDIEKTFRTLRKVNIKLNPKKCSFGLVEGVFLGPRTSVKRQILADFLIEIPADVSQAAPAAVTQEEPWTLFTDGSSCVNGSGAGLILTNPEGVEFTYALRFQFTASNNEAEYEALVASLRIAARIGVLVEVLENKSIKEKEVAAVIEEDGPTWMTQLVDYLKGDYVMREIHEGSCSMHAGPRSVVAKAVRLGYYWPTMHKDACDMIQKCNDCQIHRPITRHPQQSLTPITALWRFYKWGIDIAGPFPKGPGKVKFLIVSMDYFTKWIEAKAVATIIGGQVKKFIWDNIMCRFGIPGEIISANGKQFTDNPFKDCLGEGIKAHLGEGNKNWVEELPHVLWAHRTMIKSSHGDTPFSLTYESESVIPTEIGMPTYRTAAVDVVNNDEELRLNLDLLEERSVAWPLSQDFVYRSNDASHAIAGGKLGPKWEGPYEVTEALGNRAYKLRSTDGSSPKNVERRKPQEMLPLSQYRHGF
nr:hypothetical protein [Tanacetum cinerariifolium]